MSTIQDRVSQGFSYLIVFASTIMLGWGILGFLEFFTGLAPLMPLQNATFPSGTQFVHWLVITLSGSTFLIGYFTRWSYTPIAMIVLFVSLATMCAIQTFDFMENESRYTDFAWECTNYVIISIYLFRSKHMRDRFGKLSIASAGKIAPLST